MHNITILDWKSEFKQAYRSSIELGNYLDNHIATNYPVFIPPRLALKLKMKGPESVLWKQFVPSILENDSISQKDGLLDPIGDHIHAKGGGIIHRYYNRVLFAPTTVCPVQCRYCFRKNELHNGDDIFKQNFQLALDYLNEHPEIEEVIFTGGDPLMLSDEKIAYYLEQFAAISHLKYVRFHTRMPVILPNRLSFELYKILKNFESRFKIHLVIHTNHIEEFDEETDFQIKSFDIPKLSQTVLLKDVNDNPNTLANLFRHLSNLQVRPYYLHHPDKVYGGMHFYMSQALGQNIYQQTAKLLPGWMMPRYVVDPASGSGKISAFYNE